MLAALVLAIMGASDEQIIADYHRWGVWGGGAAAGAAGV